jgi:hypothetical protein
MQGVIRAGCRTVESPIQGAPNALLVLLRLLVYQALGHGGSPATGRLEFLTPRTVVRNKEVLNLVE